MADLLDILSLNEGKSAINLSTSVTAHDTELAMFITAVSRRIDDHVGPVVNRTVTERHSGGCGTVELRTTPVSSVTSVVEWDTAGTSTTLSAEDDDTKPADGYLLVNHLTHRAKLLRRESGNAAAFEPGIDNVVVTYVAGRAANTAAVDALFKMGAANILRRLWQREAPVWSQTPGGFAAADGIDVGFYRVIDPMVAEWFSADLDRNFVG